MASCAVVAFDSEVLSFITSGLYYKNLLFFLDVKSCAGSLRILSGDFNLFLPIARAKINTCHQHSSGNWTNREITHLAREEDAVPTADRNHFPGHVQVKLVHGHVQRFHERHSSTTLKSIET